MSDVRQLAGTALTRLRELPPRLAEQAEYAVVREAVGRRQSASLDGVWGGASAVVLADLLPLARPWLVICEQPETAERLVDDLQLFCDLPVELFPAWESGQGGHFADDAYGARMRVLKLLGEARAGTQPGTPAAIVCSIQALLQPVPTAAELHQGTLRLATGQRLELDEFQRWLVQRGFQPTSAVQLPGEFSLRGGILDVFPPDAFRPWRVELFDDEVESIRQFDPRTQRSLQPLAEVELTVLSEELAAGDQLASHLPESTGIALLEPAAMVREARRFLERQTRSDAAHPLEQVLASLRGWPTLTAAQLLESPADPSARVGLESVERFQGDLAEIRRQLDQTADGHEVFLVCPTAAEVQRVGEILATTRVATSGRLHALEGHLQQGFRMVAQRALVLSVSEIFHGGEVRRMPRRRLGKAIDSFTELKPRDLVVHLAHGIGRYLGLKLLDKDGQVEEFLEIEFAEQAKIYVPASRIGLVQKYIGGTRQRPQLAKIGGTAWLRRKRAAEAAVEDLAAEMLDLQAARVSRPGITFATDSDWQLEFDASFPYTETDDQRAAILEIKADMERPRPMDRLLCGDVGYGKTEVAMRAAFKAVDSGYQVAVLVPTTVLAQQHYQTFARRMSEFPVDIGKLSRFVSAQERKDVLAGLATGRIDIVIGTHRLASRDVQFYNLGLVIIDEEQRFGVQVKERLKSLRASVDIVTMSATPIPRTLHMSLVGVRDISNLETPPQDRIAVETRVTRFDETLIRDACLRELQRGGQIYFVHNRVADIEQLAGRLRRIVPEAKVRVGHGQMAEGELERVMVDFVEHRFDLLLATTIVESGLDIPNANTIFIDEADRYGLADLHQLRGRVGRYKHRASCYLLIDPHKHLNPNAARRLRAIEEFSEMGAGFGIAMRDLEIRGAGNLLGTQQSGHIAAVGYELYCQLLENAVRELKQEPSRLHTDVDLRLPGEAFVPADYVREMRQRIDLYRRLARVEAFDQLQELGDELRDRFGTPPEPVRRMLAIAELRMLASLWRITAILVEDRFLVFRYADPDRIKQLAGLHGRRLRVVDEKSAYLPLEETLDPDALLALTKSVLRPASGGH